MLTQYLAKPLFQKHVFGNATLNDVAPKLKQYMDTSDGMDSGDVKADTHALEFYFLNHSFGVALSKYGKFDTLPPGVVHLADTYVKRASDIAMRAFYYLYIICAREARHWHGGSKHGSVGTQITTEYGEDVWKFIQTISSSSSSGIVQLLRNGNDLSLLDVVQALRIVYHQGGWSSAYGGPAWGAVTDCMYQFLAGEYTPEMMLDTVWTLAHNNGPIFNKPFLYNGYTSTLETILDIQRSGQIPQLFSDRLEGVNYLPGSVLSPVDNLYAEIAALVPWHELRGHLDWFKVEALGAKGHYSSFKNSQKAKFGVSPYEKTKMVAKPPNPPDYQSAGTPSVATPTYVVGNSHYTKITMKREKENV